MTNTEPTERRRNTDTTAANKARMRAAEEKKADHLRSRGWICIPPERYRDSADA